ncbi:Uncharacterized protein ALO42_01352 [Pseudomonas syringae pv. atrofaciens]|uniref:Serine protease n=1 Tax=Pseudomonas syringae pv. atrofaciens TaxID=192087 RepID=A0AAD0IAW2_PSESX|nr:MULTISPECIES: serine protease [Pseudomonas syringae group]AVX25258.1 serine protease [Pseudomonas syringae pv. atrofaciens]KPW08225.1 Uncharacterized protein ALO42_01352 [Pseudomonas syringae pv. atrofaciens]PCK90140.1 serine protease [Pseudomonas viridiflava]RMP26930.1 hypothetical protein ALQ25_00536 [Pseudomonas coronafaciens pv. atropurpurea]
MGRLAENLKLGVIQDAQPWDLGSAVELIVAEIESSSLLVSSARNAVEVLINNRHYDHARTIAECWEQRHDFDPFLAKYQAQALINVTLLDEAEKVLTLGLPKLRLRETDAYAIKQIPEFEGLLGRVFKQRYVATRDPNWLVKSREQYLKTYGEGHGRYWHGINAVALLVREEREKLDISTLIPVDVLAREVLDTAMDQYFADPKNAFAAATVSEAYLAIGDCDEAEFWLYRFLMHPAVKPFDIESYDRQIREIWNGNPLAGRGSCADQLSVIITRHIAKTEHRFFISPANVRETKRTIERLSKGDLQNLEKNFSGDSTLSLQAVKMLLNACESVGCVMTTSGERVGTGFLLSGSTFSRGQGLAQVFVTNAHVISNDVPNAIAPEDAFVSFEVESTAKGDLIRYKVGEVLFTSPPGPLGVSNGGRQDLDVTIVRLNELPTEAIVLQKARSLPLVDSKTRVYVVGHPRGSGLQISLQDSRLVDVDDDKRLLHYRTPTDPGSSGSPVFNEKWEVIAVHHGGSAATPRLNGSGTYEANEGISLDAIERAWMEL